MRLDAIAVNAAWWAGSAPDAIRFGAAVRNVEATQRRVLRSILRANASTAYGREHGFAGIRTVEEFRRSVPLVGYDDLHGRIEAAARGEPDQLVPGLPRGFTPTSGSSAPSKLIPDTAALRAQFHAAVAPWVAGMYRASPRLLLGRSYWSISPVAHPGRLTSAGIPVGFSRDTEYLGPVMRALLDRTLAVPPDVSGIADMRVFRQVTLAFLLAASDLVLISVWNPMFLTLLLAPLRTSHQALARAVETGTLPMRERLPGLLAERLERLLRPDPARAEMIRRVMRDYGPDASPPYRRLWPRLCLISCWADAAARGPADGLRRLFPSVPIVPKGLIATEGVVSFPCPAAGGSVLALRSHFFEFTQGGGRVLPAWEVRKGESYGVVLTTGGGLYRYRLGDVVRITGFLRECPIVEFLGRDGMVSDLYGEKLNEAHVAAVLNESLASLPDSPEFAMLAPDGDPPNRYTLFLAGERPLSADAVERIRLRCEAGLNGNVHYEYCRRLGQLRPLAVCRLDLSPTEVLARYEAHRLGRGRRAGDIKPAALDPETGWRRRFGGGRPTGGRMAHDDRA